MNLLSPRHWRWMTLPLAALLTLGLNTLPAAAAELATIRVGVLQFGTVSWELEVMQKHGFAEREGIKLQIIPLALKDASNVAIQGGAVDLIVNDWLWVARQRADGRDFTFVPHSTAVGSIMVKADSGFENLADLRGKSLGVAGGPVDKSWLFLRAYSRKVLGEDAANVVKPAFVAPPLLNELALRGEMPAAMNFWHYAAKLRAAGWRELIGMPEMLAELGIDRSLPLVGWVFRESWANANPTTIAAFLRASAATKKLMAESDPVWEELRAMTKAENTATLHALRDGHRAGLPPTGAAAQKAGEVAAGKAFAILAQEGGKEVVGNAISLAPGVFWSSPGAR